MGIRSLFSLLYTKWQRRGRAKRKEKCGLGGKCRLRGPAMPGSMPRCVISLAAARRMSENPKSPLRASSLLSWSSTRGPAMPGSMPRCVISLAAARRMSENPKSPLRASSLLSWSSTRGPAMPGSMPRCVISLAAARRMSEEPQTPPQASLFRSPWSFRRMASQVGKILHSIGRKVGVQ